MGKAAYFFLWALVFSIPLENMVVLQGFGTISRVIGVFAVLFGGMALLMEGRGRSLSTLHLLIFGFFLWSVATFFWTIDHDSSLTTIITISQIFIFILIVWEFAKTEKALYGLFQAYLLGASIAIFNIILAYFRNDQVTYFRYSASGFDPNDISLTVALGVPIAWFLSLNSKNAVLTWVYRLYLPATFFAVVLTASRGSFLALGFSLCMLVFTLGHLRRYEKIILILLAGFSIGLMVEFIPSYSWERLSTIYGETTSGTLNARSTIWLGGLQAYTENPLFGAGVGAFSTAIEGKLGAPIAPHNVFLSILVGQGLFGFLLFLSIFFKVYIDLPRLASLEKTLWIMLFMTWAIGGMTLGWEYRKPTWFLLGLFANFVFCTDREGETAFTETAADHRLEENKALGL